MSLDNLPREMRQSRHALEFQSHKERHDGDESTDHGQENDHAARSEISEGQDQRQEVADWRRMR